MISRLCRVLPTLWRLGPRATATVATYRLACRTGLYRQWLPIEEWEDRRTFFTPTLMEPPAVSQISRTNLLNRADLLLAGDLVYFSNTSKQVGNPPDWFFDPFSKSHFKGADHWTALNEFSAGDIKKVWEASRFEWAPLLARAWRLTNDECYLSTLNNSLLDWALNNPTNAGPNWKCGQEASIRLINLLLTANLLGSQKKPSQSLVNLVARHCGRILPTIRYAVAQNNNHGTSEAAALFIGGAWMLTHSDDGSIHQNAQCWRAAGRRWLEDRVTKLIAQDGSFSQYSVNYHRVLIDTLCQVEIWRENLNEPFFSEQYYQRCCAAIEWLAVMTDVETGGAPNMGANDGARLYDLTMADYRDYRPSVQFGRVLFLKNRAYADGPWDEPLHWLNRPLPDKVVPPMTGSVIHAEGGDLVLGCGSTKAVVRFANYRFRPSHADCLHIDLWHKGNNILRDGGSYSYNTEPHWMEYFAGTESHNTVQFDGRSQMPRISRFLYGSWLKMDECSFICGEENKLSWVGTYIDWRKASHRRVISVQDGRWLIRDEIAGFRDKAVLRWRLIPGEWELSANTCDSPLASLKITTEASLRRLELTSGWESLYYQQKSELPVLEVEVGPGSCVIETEIFLKD